MKKYIVSTLVIFFIGFFNSSAKENVTNPNDNDTNNYRFLAAGCLAATAQSILEVNNVRTTILAGGDMWWDLDNAKYEIPKDSERHSMFAGALWIGGLDEQGNLKVAGMTYRQDGNDFWPGPLNADYNSDDYGTIDASTCAEFDEHYKITSKEVALHAAYYECVQDPDCDATTTYPDWQGVTPAISNWPADRVDVDGTFDYLAPYADLNGNGQYDPTDGEYPAYDINQERDCKNEDILFGDETLWWVFNDNGNIHTESGSESAIGLEIQAQAFGFTTNDEINNMTFYSYKIINRSNQSLNDTYFGQWVDPDLGNYTDDYVGCDVGLGLGYCYNGDAEDDTASGYNYDSDDPPPAIGVDFFRGPLADTGDGVDNDRDGEIDEIGEQIIMSKFVYYNNDFSQHGNPENANHYYGYLRGIWKDGQPMTYGGNGWEDNGLECNFMFPDDTDPEFSPLYGEWTEITAGNNPADRRFLQSAGPFTLEPGAVNYITTGVVWARASDGNNFASVELMKIADKKAQTLFDICFEVIDGPSAPDLNFVELDKELIINLTNSESSNNYANQYVEENPFISDILGIDVSYSGEWTDPVTGETIDVGPIYEDYALNIDKDYKFEGYQVFQLKDETVSQTDLYNPDKAYMIYQCDVENYRTSDGQIVSSPSDDTTPIANLVNYNLDESVGPGIYVPQNMTLSAENAGITHSFRVTEDKFATGNTALVNNKVYHFMAIAYAYNEYIPYDPEIPFTATNSDTHFQPSNVGQKQPYLAGRKNIRRYTAIPHKIESFGNMPTADYGTIPSQQGLAGRGNGGKFLEITPECRNEIAENFSADVLSYRKNMSPADITVVDPLSVPDADFIFQAFIDTGSVDGVFSVNGNIDNPDDETFVNNSRWSLTKIENGDTVIEYSSNTLVDQAQQILPDWGLAVRFKPVPELEGGQLDNLGCLSCNQVIPSVSNPVLDNLFWDANLSAQEMADVVSSIEWQQSVEDLWISKMPDIELWQIPPVAFTRPADWVRSGTNAFSTSNEAEATSHYYGDVSANGTQLDPGGTTDQQTPLDPNEVHEEQWLVPYKLISTDYRGRVGESSTTNVINSIDVLGGGLAWHDYKYDCSLNTLNNVDIVLTPDTSLWTRCPILDMSEGSIEWIESGQPSSSSNGSTWGFNVGPGDAGYPWAITASESVEITPTGENETSFNNGDGASKWDLRLAPNVGKDGEPDQTGEGFNSENGWGWFPGYAVNVSTGKRLNLMFSENSSLGEEHNANDMRFNPTPYNFMDASGAGIYTPDSPWEADRATMNGGHAVFILDTEYQGHNAEDNPHYSSYVGSSENSAWNNLRKKQVIPHIQWVGNWLSSDENTSWDENMKNEVVIRARVAEAYGYRETSSLETITTTTINDKTGKEVSSEYEQAINIGYPYYKFDSSEIRTVFDDMETQQAAVEDINIVPNPYYGMSGYESNQVDTRVKITNLPRKCTISVYTINGNLVRQYSKDSEEAYLEWDLKNEYGIQIASGMYIIYIDAGELGEKTLKWFGALRPIDLNTF